MILVGKCGLRGQIWYDVSVGEASSEWMMICLEKKWWMQQVKEMKWRWVICGKGYGLHTQSGLTLGCHSQALSRYRTTRGLLPAGFPPSAGSPLLRRPGQPDLRQTIHIGAVLSVDTRSTCTSKHQFSRSREIPHPGLQVARLQAHATTPSQPYHTYSTNSLLLLLHYYYYHCNYNNTTISITQTNWI